MQMQNHKEEKRRVILVTGCSSGIGKDICKNMKMRGNIVVATARKVGELKELDADLKLELDVTKEESIQKVIDEIIKKYRRIDVLVNNAGYSVRGVIEEVSIDDAEKIFQVNVFGIMRMIQAVAPIMRKNQFGKIINIGSISGRYTQAANGSYCAAKHAVEAISEAARLELAPYNVQVSVIEPGPMQTEFFNTLSKTSDYLMENINSPYHSLYEKDIKFRKSQKRMPSEIAAERICNIIMKNKIKARYIIAFPYIMRAGIKILEIIK